MNLVRQPGQVHPRPHAGIGLEVKNLLAHGVGDGRVSDELQSMGLALTHAGRDIAHHVTDVVHGMVVAHGGG